MNRQTNVANEMLSTGHDAINELFIHYYQASLRIAHGFLRSRDDSEDAVQTAFGAAFRQFHRFRGESNVKTWFTRILVNCCFMHLRRRSSARQIPLEELGLDVQAFVPTPEILCYWRELQDAHQMAMLKLPRHLMDVYAPCMNAGMTPPAVAHHLGLTAAAAKSRMFRARKNIEHNLRPALQGNVPKPASRAN